MYFFLKKKLDGENECFYPKSSGKFLSLTHLQLLAGCLIQLLQTTFRDVEIFRIKSLSVLHTAFKSNSELMRD